MQPLIKWPGGKSSEIQYIIDIIPKNYERYVEPFCGGAAVFFYLEPRKAIINDISFNLTKFYDLIKNEDLNFKKNMYELYLLWENIKFNTKKSIKDIKKLFYDFKNFRVNKEDVKTYINKYVETLLYKNDIGIINNNLLIKEVKRRLADKFFRVYNNEIKFNTILSEKDLEENLLTGVSSGIYMAIRNELNCIERNHNLNDENIAKKIALFYFVREFCYGSMFRYNQNGDFNIPYGGKGYNNKNYKKKLDAIFSDTTVDLLKNVDIRCGDFEDIFYELKENDFIFLDPPYDTDFSDYENKTFDKKDQIRLNKVLEMTKSKFIMIIKNTPFIFNLYNKECFKIKSFNSNYSYCVKNRNDRETEHLIITNY